LKLNDVQIGEVTLYNDYPYPYNNSTQTVALEKSMNNKKYFVYTELVNSQGHIGEVRVFDKLLNGFKIAYSGSSTTATFRYIVKGGFEE
jgi:hypothetical protein